MLIHTIPPAIILASAIYASWSAADEKRRIDEATEANTGDLDHGPLLLRRVLWCGVGLAALAGLNLWTGTSQWSLLLYAGMAWAAFGILHVYWLNRKRGLLPWYVSPGNWWDRQWIRTTGLDYFWETITWHAQIYNSKEQWYHLSIQRMGHSFTFSVNCADYRKRIHQAGKRAFWFRTLTLLATLAAFYRMTTP